MDSWWPTAQQYSRLRASSTQMNQLNLPPGLNVGQSVHQLNVNDHLGLGVTANATNQAMSGHYGSTAAHPHPWGIFSSHGLNAASHQAATHESSSFNANSFFHPSYDSSFLSASFQSKAAYLPTPGVGTGFFNSIKKADNDMNNLRNAAYCSTMSSMPGMSAATNMTSDPNSSLTATGSLFPSHLQSSNWRHNLIASNTPSGPFGVLPHQTVNAMNAMNSTSNTIGSSHSHSHPSHTSHASHTSHTSHSSHLGSHNTSHHSSSSHNKSSNENQKVHHYHHHINNKTPTTTMSGISSVDNSFRNIMPSLPPTQSSHAIQTRGQNSFDTNINAKITGHHHQNQTDPYASGMFAMAAAAHAIGSDYVSMQTQRYASGIASGNQQAMNAFASNTTSRGSYPSIGFHTDPSARSRELLSSSSLLQNSKQSSANSCNSRNVNAMNAMNATNYLPNCAMMPIMNNSANYSSSPANNSISNNLSANHPVSRSSSAASNHGLTQGNDSSCSFGYNSPATNLPQSPYPQPQRSNTSNSSQGTTTATGAAVQSSTQDYTNYSNSQVFQSMGNQTPTPTPGGYPTPPSSVGQPHLTSANTQPTNHEEQVSHYSHITPQTPTQTNQFSANYSNFGSNAKLTTNGNRSTDSILSNSSSCMVAAAAVANMNNSQNSSSSVSQSASGYMMSESESCGLSNMTSVNPIADNINNNKLTNDTQMNASNHVIGHQSNEPTLNSVFTSPEIDFPIINFTDEANNAFNSNLKLDNSFNNKKSKKNNKKSKKKDKNKNNNNVINLVDPNNSFPTYSYPTQEQYTNSYSNPNPYLMSQNIGHPNQTSQESQVTHVLPNDANAGNTHTNTTNCYDMQYQQHIQQQQVPQQSQTQMSTHQTQADHDLIQMPHESLHQSVQQTQDHQMMEPVMSMASQHLTPTTTNESVAEKQSFPTIDDELSFLTEPTDCVSMETQTPNMNTSVQIENQSSLVISHETTNIGTDQQNAEINSNEDLNAIQNNMNSNNSNSNIINPYLKSYITFCNSPKPTVPSSGTKEKKKKKLKESNENKIKQNNNTLNGQKSCKNGKKVKLEDNYEYNGMEDNLGLDFDQKKKNFSTINQNNTKLMSGENFKKSTTAGDRENYESKFFKRRPSTNMTINNVHIIEMERKDVKNNKKRKNKFDLNMFNSESRHMIDEYEFPDSPPNSHSLKKSRKSSSSDKQTKKSTTADFEKITSPSFNLPLKKTKKSINNLVKPVLPNSTTESIENSINSVVLNTGLSQITDNLQQSEQMSTIDVMPNVTTNLNQTTNSVNNNNINNNNDISNTINNNQLPVNSSSCNNNNNNSCSSNSNSSNNNNCYKNPIQNHVSTKKCLNVVNTSSTTIATISSIITPIIATTPALTITTTPLNTSTVAIEHILSPIQITPTILTTNTMLSTSPGSSSTPTINTNTLTTPTINNNSNQQSVGMQSAGTNTPRRRSQDKKASTIREGLMRTGDFVVSIDESQYDLPVIWRIEGKSLLQRFEPQEQDDITVYINTSSYSAWNPTVRQRYVGVDVRVMGCSRTRIVVEKLGLTQANPNAVNGTATIERVGQTNKCNSSQSVNNSLHNQENFEVFIQTLISQALDPNFISEIVKENDEYFLSHVQEIDEICSRKKSRFFSKVKWDANIVKCVETYPEFTVTAQNNVGDLRCRLCHDNWSTQIMQFSGEPYNQMTLEPQTGVDLKQTKYAACDQCTDKIVLYSHLHHQKHTFFNKCKSKVDSIRGGDESKESHVILELCLQDSDWINTLFKELEDIWLDCDKIR
ncbi:probable serine/threonine-protein kinase DDB_G0282963 [Oppia nitens]|uniref:probable serine/threonine-protein kinase DDB_G0282963 n=1 Tax=Oppia nitens TaxID=1686743 RepID=UPI0023DC9CC6|nr:probable serine/threonine-protein kinase DDB_G0282963 [Oppia nitens]